MNATTATRGWIRVWILRQERCSCQSYLCPFTLGQGFHSTYPKGRP